MLRVSEIKLPLGYTETTLRKQAARRLKIPVQQIDSVSLYKKAVDARKKENVHFICTADVSLQTDEAAVLKRCQDKKITLAVPYHYEIGKKAPFKTRPVVVGFGPAGIFAALVLSRAGLSPIVIERGHDVDTRQKDVQKFWNSAQLNPNSNVQFGEGGAGTFSDGKLTTGTKDSRLRFILSEFVKAGAPEEILYLSKPHIGTDKLRGVIKSLRRELVSLGADIRFGEQLTGFTAKDGRLSLIQITTETGGRYELETEHLVLAIGHSARDTFELLYDKGLTLLPKPFSIGARIEHSQQLINHSQHGAFGGHPALGAADYKLSAHLKNGRGVYTFCMCPGGQVVAAASEKGMVVTNGMSEFSRSAQNANSALLVGVTPEDYMSGHPLCGMYFQRQWEQRAFSLGGGNYQAPAQRVEDFLRGRESRAFGEIKPSYTAGATPSDLSMCLPTYVVESMRQGILEFDKRLKGFAHPDAVLTGVETRSSSPVRIVRDDHCEALCVKGLYPCGEGAGYAGGIVSAAVDGIRCAEIILQKTQEQS